MADGGRTGDSRRRHVCVGLTLRILAGALGIPSLLIPRRDLQVRGRKIRHHLKERTGHLLVWFQLLGEAPERFTARIAGGLPDIAKEQVRFQHIGALGQNTLTRLGSHLRLPIPPERLSEADMRVEAVGGLVDHAAELLDRLGQHMPLGVETGEAGTAQAQRRPLSSPHLRVEAQKLRAQLRHVGTNLKGLLKLAHGAVELTLTLVGNAKANMRGDVLGIGVQHTTERHLSQVKLTSGQICLTKDAMGLKVLGEIFEDVLRHTDRLLNLVDLKEAAGLIICGLQAYCRHPGSSCCRVTEQRG